MQDNPFDSVDLLARVQQVLDDFIAERMPALTQISADSAILAEALHTYIRGGKRLRPAFAYWGYRSVGHPDSDAIVHAAASLEFLQACALMHDDVMDASDMRRGMPAMHKHFEVTHKDQQWSGSSELFGIGAAILVGDLALSWADEMLLESTFESQVLKQAKDMYDVMRTELMAGQYLDLLEQSRQGTDAHAARNVIRYKSAKYSIERPLHIGALLGGASQDHLKVLSNYGLAIGEAFQLRDDLLGVFGEAHVTGKPQGDDLREGKQTVLIAYAREHADKDISVLLDSHLGKNDLDDQTLGALHAALHDSGAVQRIEDDIDRLTEQALTAISTSTIPAPAQSALTQLAYLATQRTA